jgi:hypothetical protein
MKSEEMFNESPLSKKKEKKKVANSKNKNIELKCIRIIIRSKNRLIIIVDHLTTIFPPIMFCKFPRCSLGVSSQHKNLVLNQAQ